MKENRGCSYSEYLDPDKQITAEEDIAHFLHDAVCNEHLETDEDCAEAGRQILKMVLKKFRPDLFESPHSPEGM